MNEYFIVLDEAPIKGSPTPKYDMLVGNPDEATGTLVKSGRTIKELLPSARGLPVYRVYLARTDGREGKNRLQ